MLSTSSISGSDDINIIIFPASSTLPAKALCPASLHISEENWHKKHIPTDLKSIAANSVFTPAALINELIFSVICGSTEHTAIRIMTPVISVRVIESWGVVCFKVIANIAPIIATIHIPSILIAINQTDFLLCQTVRLSAELS